jgi:hypothetical protein
MTEQSSRQARLRPEFAHLYAPIVPDRWELAAVMTDRVLARLLAQPGACVLGTARVLPDAHFDFRGDWPLEESAKRQSRRICVAERRAPTWRATSVA